MVYRVLCKTIFLYNIVVLLLDISIPENTDKKQRSETIHKKIHSIGTKTRNRGEARGGGLTFNHVSDLLGS